MKIPMQWINAYAPINVDAETYQNKMIMIGNGVEGYEELGGEIDNVVVGKVLTCVDHPNSDHLHCTTVDVGGEERTVVSGIKQWYAPEDLLGKTVVLVANLKPVKLCGIESRGMILCASDEADEKLSALTTLREMESGLKVR